MRHNSFSLKPATDAASDLVQVWPKSLRYLTPLYSTTYFQLPQPFKSHPSNHFMISSSRDADCIHLSFFPTSSWDLTSWHKRHLSKAHILLATCTLHSHFIRWPAELLVSTNGSSTWSNSTNSGMQRCGRQLTEHQRQYWIAEEGGFSDFECD